MTFLGRKWLVAPTIVIKYSKVKINKVKCTWYTGIAVLSHHSCCELNSEHVHLLAKRQLKIITKNRFLLIVPLKINVSEYYVEKSDTIRYESNLKTLL